MTEAITRRIGGTDISALLGLNPYRGPRSVYDRIVLGIQEPGNVRTQRGSREEPRIRSMWVESTGAILEPHPGIIQHPAYDFATVSPDDLGELHGKRATIDYKSVSVWGRKKWGDDLTDAAPEHISCQLHWAMEVTGRDLGLIGAAFGEDLPDGSFDIRELCTYIIQRDDEISARLLGVAERFWNEHILLKVPPPPDLQPVKKTKTKAKLEVTT